MSSLLGANNQTIIVALDYTSMDAALALADRIDPRYCHLKVGKGLYTRTGPTLIQALHQRGFKLFLDLKFHDIPATVASAVTALADLGVWMINVHAQGGSRMMQAARVALQPYADAAPLLIAVTVLTSLTQADLLEIGVAHPATTQVLHLARLAHQCSMDGVVCSAQETAIIKRHCPPPFLQITPGIRPVGCDNHDQRRTTTPLQAKQCGADYLVIGRPITQAADPLAALEAIISSLQEERDE